MSELEHEAFLEVNGGATEAAAFRSGEIPTDAAQGFSLGIDRQFVSAIREKQVESVLFIGGLWIDP